MDSLSSSNQSKWYAVTLAATSSAIVSVIVGYPFDSIKTRMQAFHYKSSWHCIQTTYQMEGLVGFYRGVFPVMLSVCLFRSFAFNLYVKAKSVLYAFPFFEKPKTVENNGSYWRKVAIVAFLSGSWTGSIAAFLNAPFEMIKIQKQLARLNMSVSTNDHAHSLKENLTIHSQHLSSESRRQNKIQPQQSDSSFRHKSAWTWAKEIFKRKGILGLYIGVSLHILRDSLGTGMYFCTYELFKYFTAEIPTPKFLSVQNASIKEQQQNNKENQKLETLSENPMVHMIAGGLAASLCWIVLYPIDLVKSVIQRDALQPIPKYQNSMQFIKIAWKEGGLRKFYSGIGPQLIRSFPVHSLNFFVYEQVMRHIR